MLAKKWFDMAKDIDNLPTEQWRELKEGHEFGVKLAEMIYVGMIDTLSKSGKRELQKAHDAIKYLR